MDPVPHKPVMSVMSATSVRSNIPVPIWPSSLTSPSRMSPSRCLLLSICIWLAWLSRASRVPRNLDKQRPVILPAREILLIHRPKPRVKLVATEAVQLQTADCRLQTIQSRRE